MASWASIDDVIAGLVAGQRLPFTFPSITTVSGRYCNMNKGATHRWGIMATPAAASAGGTLHVDSEAGFPPFTNAGGSNELRLGAVAGGMVTSGILYLYDRVWSCSGLDGTVTTAQSVTGFPALTRPDAGGSGLELFAEIYTQIGTTPANITVSYTNQANTAGRTSQSQVIGGTGLREVQRVIPLPLQQGDTGVKSIASATLSGSTGTAGDFGLMLAKRIATLSIAGAAADIQDWSRTGLPLIQSDAALMFLCLNASTSTGAIDGDLLIGEH